MSNVNLGFYADNFKVLGNEMGNLHVSSNLELTGTLANPKLQGDLGVSTGNIKLDPILAQLQHRLFDHDDRHDEGRKVQRATRARGCSARSSSTCT